MSSLALRPGDSLAAPWTALSIDFISFVSSTNAIQATGFLTLTLVGLTPTEHASLTWTYCHRTTVSGLTTMGLSRHPFQDRASQSQNIGFQPWAFGPSVEDDELLTESQILLRPSSSSWRIGRGPRPR